MKIAPVLAMFLVLTACAPTQYENAGSVNRFEDDKYDCQVLLGYVGAQPMRDVPDQLTEIANIGRNMQRCLERKGWRVAQQ